MEYRGGMAGHGWSLAWRVYDAQYWGVPQRRKRIYLIADFASEHAGEILFERESVRGDSETCGETREGTAADVERSFGRSGGVKCLNPWDCQSNVVCVQNTGRGWWNESEIAATLRTPCGGDSTKANLVVYGVDCRNAELDEENTHNIQAKANGGISLNCTPSVCYAIDQQGGKGNASYQEDVSPTLCSDSHGTPHGVAYRSGGYGDMVEGVGTLRANGGDAGRVRRASSLSVFENHSQDTRYNGPVDVSQTVSATFGMGGNNTPFVVEKYE